MNTFGISLGFPRLSQSSGQVTHVLLTRSRLCPGPKSGSSLHLHVLSTPPAFVLSQDQTLREELLAGEAEAPQTVTKSSSGPDVWRQVHGRHGLDGLILAADINVDAGRFEPGRTPDRSTSDPSAHAVEFSKTAAPSREGDSFSDGAPEQESLRADS